MPKVVDLELKRSEFIAASVDVIAQDGLSAATMRKIAKEAGCTTGSLTHYFVNRKALLLETLRFVHNNASRRMMSTIISDHTHEQKLRTVLAESLPLDATRFKEWRVWLAFWSASMDDEDLTKENTRRYQQWLTLITGLLKPLLPVTEVSMEAKRLITLIDGLGVGIVRQRVGPQALTDTQRECQTILNQHLLTILSTVGNFDKRR